MGGDGCVDISEGTYWSHFVHEVWEEGGQRDPRASLVVGVRGGEGLVATDAFCYRIVYAADSSKHHAVLGRMVQHSFELARPTPEVVSVASRLTRLISSSEMDNLDDNIFTVLSSL